jgi:hypothetical protein
LEERRTTDGPGTRFLPAGVDTGTWRLANKDKSPLAEAKTLSAAARIEIGITDATAKNNRRRTREKLGTNGLPLLRYAIRRRDYSNRHLQSCLNGPTNLPHFAHRKNVGFARTLKPSVRIIDQSTSKISFGCKPAF